MVLVSAVARCALLPVLAVAPTAPAMRATRIVFGAGMGSLDVAMNAHAVEVEQRHEAALMSGFHGMCSLGGLVGALAMAGLLATGESLLA